MTEAPGLERIPGLSRHWLYRPSDRTVLWQSLEADDPRGLISIGTVPQMTGIIADLNEDGSRQIIAYQFIARSGHQRVMTEFEAKRGTWSRKDGQPRPTGPDARRAFARTIHAEAEKAEAAARKSSARISGPDGA